jgi:DNA-binding transcriptional regulator YdaS (Cro superfamily)
MTAEDPVAAYKALLRELIARRPSGTRQKIAAATGTHPSFISQLTNPALRVPLPAQHIPAIFRVCHFSPEERAAFLACYGRAHPSQSAAMEDLAAGDRDVVRVVLPDLGDARLREEVESLIRDFSDRVVAIVRSARKD